MPLHFDGSFKNISERKQAEETLKQSEANYRQLFELSAAPMWVFDMETYRFVQVNQACINNYGYSEDEFAAMMVTDLHPQDDGTETVTKKSGDKIDVETSSIPVTANGKKQILVIALDITEKKQYEKKLARAAIKAQEDERYEIGGELHDNVCQVLATSLMYLGMMKKLLPPDSQTYFDKTREYISSAANEIRNLSHQLAPAFFDEATLEDAFEGLLKNFNVENKYTVDLHFDEDSKFYPLNRELQLNLYRILQEQVRNIAKYAQASGVAVTLSLQQTTLQMRITDNGIGFDMERIKAGIGLANMNRRTQLFGGNFTVVSSVGNGCTIIVDIPLAGLN
jgi:signal transduction histidine kinase